MLVADQLSQPRGIRGGKCVSLAEHIVRIRYPAKVSSEEQETEDVDASLGMVLRILSIPISAGVLPRLKSIQAYGRWVPTQRFLARAPRVRARISLPLQCTYPHDA